MGRRGPLPKPPGRAVGHRRPGAIVRLAPSPKLAVPRAPEGLLASTRRDWRAFWQSARSGLVCPEDRPALERLFRMRDDLEREGAIFREARLMRGSVGQWRMNPLAEHMMKLESAIVRLENEFGLTPLAASRLGLAFGEATKSLEELNRRLDEREDDDDDDPTAALLLTSADGRRSSAAQSRS